MNRLLICRLLGIIVLLIGGSMVMSLPWAFPLFGQVQAFERAGFFGIVGTMLICGAVGGGLVYLGRSARGEALFRRDAIAVVGLSWILATVLGAVPYWISGTAYGVDAEGHPAPMGFFDGIFESASGFSGTGASVLTQLEDPQLVPRAILFWRSQTHFLGGLGIMVLFVAILGLGPAGKALMMTEMPGPSKEGAHVRIQRSAHIFAAIFVGLCAVLTLLLWAQGMSWYDALCQSFGTVATGGFSTHNKSIEYFNSAGIEMTITVFMAIACTNFTLLYYVLLMQPGKLLGDVEFRVYLAIMAISTLMVVLAIWLAGNYASLASAARYGVFQVVSIQTNTGFGTADFDQWTGFSKAVLLVLMFIGGCAGSTSCSVKVIRYVLFFKLLGVEMEQVFHPNVVRPVRLGDKPISDPDLLHDVAVYFVVIAVVFVVAWVALMGIEPESTWPAPREKLTDCASAVAATLNGVGPGLGIVGETKNYSRFHGPSKLVLTGTMLLGRLEVFVLAVLFIPGFWRRR
jgi:trk system potassium uptake protein TrkH